MRLRQQLSEGRIAKAQTKKDERCVNFLFYLCIRRYGAYPRTLSYPPSWWNLLRFGVSEQEIESVILHRSGRFALVWGKYINQLLERCDFPKRLYSDFLIFPTDTGGES
ncbi:hypothetical protein DRN74_06060 [Candidatus Micrarchaeota archaeon]|nr:MAG: hypothetical protein DRN74_06060 [Candidatus Micrarchaeota archaeon]